MSSYKSQAQGEYTLTVHVIGGGSVIIEPNQVTYRHGDVVTLTARFSQRHDLVGTIARTDRIEQRKGVGDEEAPIGRAKVLSPLQPVPLQPGTSVD